MLHNKKAVVKTALSALLLSAVALPVTANAAVYTPEGRSTVYKTSLSTVEGLDARVLDWRNPTLEFTFDASDTDWTDDLELLLSADPMGKVSRLSPLMVQFNNGKPTPVITRGQGFDARIKLDKARMRPRNNKIRFTYNTPAGASCLTPQHGGWRLDFKNSLVIIKARAKAQNFDIRDIEARLGNPTTAPKSVRILARGQNTAKLQALAAQGMGLRMANTPEFKTQSGHGEFDIVMARRDKLSGWVTDEKILSGRGPNIFAHEGRPMRLIITGDTDTEVMETAKSFATYKLPNAHRPVTSLGEMKMQASLSASTHRIDGTAKLDDLGGGYFDNGWGPKPQSVTFNVNDPAASTGEVLLRLASDKVVADDSRVMLDLNGKSLGYAKLNKTRKTVAFKIPAGHLQGTDNVLSITPELNMENMSGCNFTQTLPGFYLGSGSKLKIETAAPSPVAELSKMTATGAPFSIEQGGDTIVMLPASSSRDYNASLKILAKLAKSSGQGWTQANYVRSTNMAAIGADKNVLVIGPSTNFDRAIMDGAPKGLSSALKGQSFNGANRIASIDRFASNDEGTILRQYAERQAQAGRISSGGVAALYPSPQGGGNVIGVITNAPGRSFSSVAGQLIQPKTWNALEGSVTRWDRSKVIMAQTAMAVPGFAAAQPAKSKLSNFKLPELSWPEFEPIDMSAFSGKFESLKMGITSRLGAKKASKVIAPNLKPKIKVTPVPELRGLSKVPSTQNPTASKLAALKTWTANASARTQKAWEKLDLNGSIQALKAKANASNKTIKSSKSLALGKDIMNSPIIMLIIALTAFFLLLGLLIPSRGQRRSK